MSTIRKNAAIILSVIMTLMLPAQAMAGTWEFDGSVWKNYNGQHVALTGWYSEGIDSWFYLLENGTMVTGWLNEYHFHEISDGNLGKMDFGWYFDGIHWYYLNTEHNGSFGAKLTGWQWIDGYCYYFDGNGIMLAGCQTPDGYQVDQDGRYTVNAIPQYIEGKGLVSHHIHAAETGTLRSGGGGNSGGGGSDNTSQKKDGDNDGMEDDLEAFLGTDSQKQDTDGDGLSDYIEVMETMTDPARYDSDNDGISDGDTDLDQDGLTNLEEIRYGTSCGAPDTDYDGLSDYDEIFIYHTSPSNPDTDGDGIMDGREIELVLDPLLARSDGITPDGDRRIDQKLYGSGELSAENDAIPFVEGQITADQAEQIRMDIYEEDAFLNSTFACGKAVKLTTAVPVTLSFETASPESMIILYYPEDGGQVQIPKEYTSDSKVSVEAESGIYQPARLIDFLDYVGAELPSLEKTASFSMSREDKLDNANNISYSLDEIESWSQYSNEDLLDMAIDSGADRSAKPADGKTNAETATSSNAESVATGSNAEVPDQSDQYETIASGSNAAMLYDSRTVAEARVVFVIDDTGSMGPYIQNVKKNIIEFNNMLFEQNVKASYGLITYKDILQDGADSTIAHPFNGNLTTTNPRAYATELNALTAYGGGDTDETPIDAFYQASRLFDGYTGQKFIILVTDAPYKNDSTTSFHGMEDAIGQLKQKGIQTSVVSKNNYAGIYNSLYSSNGGMFMNINDSNFSGELAKLAGLIVDTSDGEWILLDNFTRVRLDGPLSPEGDCDTDGDGLPDHIEITGSYELSLTGIWDKLLLLLSGYELNEALLMKTIRVYSFKSNPTLKDTDYDGVMDDEDDHPRENSFSGEWKNLGQNCITNASYKIDFRAFFHPSTDYNPDLAELSLILSALSYSEKAGSKVDENKGSRLTVNGKKYSDTKELLESRKFEDVEDYVIKAADEHVSEMYMGYKTVQYNSAEKTIVSITVRGTNSTLSEWSSNFNIGSESEGDWANPDNHKGFDITAMRLKSEIDSYIQKHHIDNPAFWITGHSRGAGIANLLAAYYCDDYEVFGYTFAAPGTTTAEDYNSSRYSSIFNIINEDDFVPMLPCAEWGFHVYGVEKRASAGNYASDIRKNTRIYISHIFNSGYEPMEYKANQPGVKNLAHSISGIAVHRDDNYSYFCECHNYKNKQYLDHYRIDNSNRTYELILDKYPEVCKPYYETTKLWIGYDVCQTGAMYMQLLANVMGGGDPSREFVLIDVAYRFEGFKFAIGWLYRIEKAFDHPHYCETYYAMTRNLN